MHKRPAKPRAAHPTPRRRRLRTDTHAVSDMVGNILLIAVTVLMVAGLGAALAAQPGPVEKRYTGLTTTLDQGSGDWGTGDEAIRLEHRGGEPLLPQETTIRYTIGGTITVLTADQLGSAFSDGAFTIGETWTRTLTISAASPVDVDVVSTVSSGSSLVSTSRLGANCGTDTAPPAVLTWTQNPLDLSSSSTGDVSITIFVADACSGVDQTQPPTLFYRINDGTNPAFTNGGAMTLTGVSTWQANIPDPTWTNHAGETLQYYAGSLTDLRANSGTSTTQSDLIQADCSSDTNPPTVQIWTQTPNDVTSATTGNAVIVALLTDDCAGVDNDAHPELHYRINDGTDPAFTNGGPMVRTAQDRWQGPIPDPTWASQSGKTLEYELRLMKDLNANAGTSTRQSDLIQSSCAGDVTPPTVQSWLQSPIDVASSTIGTLTITATLSDDCIGVDTGANPELHYRINDGTDPAFTNGGAMTPTTGTTWQKEIPDLGWGTQGGRALEYELRLMKDLNANAGTSTRQSDAIQTVTVYTYVNSNTPATGTVSNFGSAQSAADADAEATVAEADTAGNPSTTTLAATTHANSNAFTPENVLASDSQYAYLYSNDGWVEGAGFTAPGGATSVSQVVVGFEGRKYSAVAHEQTVSAQGSGGTSIASPSVTGTAGHVYLAAVANGETNVRTVTGVAGLGLTWTVVDAQSGSEGKGRTEVWVGTGTPSGNGAVTATFSGTVDRKIIVVSRYSGADTTNPVQAHGKAEAAGSGTDTWSVAAIAGATEGRLYAAVNVQNHDNVAFTNPTSEHADVDSGDKIQLAVADGSAAASNAASGTIPQGSADWQAVALTLRPATTQVRLAYSVGGTPGTTTLTQTLTTTESLYTVDITADRAWTIADLSQLAVRVEATSLGGNYAMVDRVYATVTTSTPTYATDIRMDFAGVSSGSTQSLELRYRTTGDTFSVHVWDGSAYRPCTGTLNSASLATFSCSLVLPAEYQSGSPRIRFTDTTPTGASQGTLFIEYARVKTN